MLVEINQSNGMDHSSNFTVQGIEFLHWKTFLGMLCFFWPGWNPSVFDPQPHFAICSF